MPRSLQLPAATRGWAPGRIDVPGSHGTHKTLCLDWCRGVGYAGMMAPVWLTKDQKLAVSVRSICMHRAVSATYEWRRLPVARSRCARPNSSCFERTWEKKPQLRVDAMVQVRIRLALECWTPPRCSASRVRHLCYGRRAVWSNAAWACSKIAYASRFALATATSAPSAVSLMSHAEFVQLRAHGTPGHCTLRALEPSPATSRSIDDVTWGICTQLSL